MDIGSIFLILGLLILVGLFVSRPFFERKAVSVSEAEHELSALLAERDRILSALQELDFDHILNKIPEEDYPTQRTSLLQRGADILRQLDAFHTESRTQAVEDRLEAAIAARAAYRTASSTSQEDAKPVGADSDDDLEMRIAARRRARQGKASGFCHKCGGPLQKSDRFCPKCGTELT